MEYLGHQNEVVLRPSGAGRFFAAAFLLFWLCGWAAGEAFALRALASGVLASSPPSSDSLFPTVFLLVWAFFWTVGGAAAAYQFVRLVWATDRLRVEGSRLIVKRGLGPISFQRSYERSAVKGITVRTQELVAETPRGYQSLSSLGTAVERQTAAKRLQALLGLQSSGEGPPPVLPAAWEEIRTDEGERAVVVSSRLRWKQTVLVGLVCMGACGLAYIISLEHAGKSMALPGVISVSSVGVLISWLIGRYLLGRKEWVLGSGSIRLQRRRGSSVETRFEARRIELRVEKDSDGDHWYHLEACRESAGTSEVTSAAIPGSSAGPASPEKERERISHHLHDPTELKSLGRWMSAQAKVPFEDRTGQREREVDLSQLIESLEDSGRVGRWVARLIESRRKAS